MISRVGQSKLSLSPVFLYWFFYLVDQSIVESKVLKSPLIILQYFFPFRSFNAHFTHVGALVLIANVFYNCCVFLRHTFHPIIPFVLLSSFVLLPLLSKYNHLWTHLVCQNIQKRSTYFKSYNVSANLNNQDKPKTH